MIDFLREVCETGFKTGFCGAWQNGVHLIIWTLYFIDFILYSIRFAFILSISATQQLKSAQSWVHFQPDEAQISSLNFTVKRVNV
jgi:hypothetical protein